MSTRAVVIKLNNDGTITYFRNGSDSYIKDGLGEQLLNYKTKEQVEQFFKDSKKRLFDIIKYKEWGVGKSDEFIEDGMIENHLYIENVGWNDAHIMQYDYVYFYDYKWNVAICNDEKLLRIDFQIYHSLEDTLLRVNKHIKEKGLIKGFVELEDNFIG